MDFLVSLGETYNEMLDEGKELQTIINSFNSKILNIIINKIISSGKGTSSS
jgi:hypothetical protein